MELALKGNVDQILEEQSGEGKNGPWRKRDFILEIPGKYPRKVCITQWGDNIDKADVQKGEAIVAHIDIQSREYKGNWYTDVKAWKIERQGQTQEEPSGPPKPSEEIYDVDDDLPF